MIIHKKFMRIALSEARKGLGKTAPNPCVGCVIVKDTKVIAKGYHERFGRPHAEAIALSRAKEKARGAVLYVTLEPCSYFGKTPPCVDAIINAGIKEVIIAANDPNPANCGKGIKILRKAGIRVVTGILKKEADALNGDFIKRMSRKRPFISLKLALSLDGKIATRTGDSKWISSEASRRTVQGLRAKNDAIMVGVNTVLRDDPKLSVRTGSRAPVAGSRENALRQPKKIIVDSKLKTPPDAKIFSKESPGEVMILTGNSASKAKEDVLRRNGAQVLRIELRNGKIDIARAMKLLLQKGITCILCEGGGELAADLMENKLVDRLFLFIAPILIGGKNAVSAFGGRGIDRIAQAVALKYMKLRKTGRDLLVEAEI